MASSVDLTALMRVMSVQEQELARSEQRLDKAKSKLDVVTAQANDNRKQLKRVGLSEPEARHLSGDDLIKSCIFSFLDVEDLEKVGQISSSYKTIIATNNYAEFAFIARMNQTNPIRAAELSVASPAEQRVEFSLTHKIQEAENRTRALVANCEILKDIVVVNAIAVKMMAMVTFVSAFPSMPVDPNDLPSYCYMS